MYIINWDLWLKVIGTLTAAIVGICQAKKLLPTSKDKLKEDFEILKAMDPNDPAYSIVKNHINDRLKFIYDKPTSTLLAFKKILQHIEF